ncbi:hypothetical protein QYF61_015962 [Mycteria americana]|uniref:Tudor domain-containing protein n=1 Tax=Mycteria americana TaxID=33587 RepID=A0AAN7RSI2_MYCAM|nr:hypothetical protein QYF61_015962 [Mycteria americana]
MAAERGYWSSLTTLQKAAVVLGIPAGAAVFYILYRRYRESREERLTFVGDEELEIEMRVPRAAVKSIIGRKGATIKKVSDARGSRGDGKGPSRFCGTFTGSPRKWQPGTGPPTLCPQLSQETGARIDVEGEDEGEETVLLISGSPTQVCRAKAAVHQIVTESAPVSEQLCVPQRAVGRIIGTSAPPGALPPTRGGRGRWEASQIYRLGVCGGTIAVKSPDGVSVPGQESRSGSLQALSPLCLGFPGAFPVSRRPGRRDGAGHLPQLGGQSALRARGRRRPGPHQGHPALGDAAGGGSRQGEREAGGLGDGSAPQPNPLLFPPKKLIMEKLMEDDAFRKELAQSTATRCQRKQPPGSRWEQEPLPDGVPEDGGSSWGEGSLLGQAPFEEAEELEDESEELEEPAAGPDAAVPKFEGKRRVCVVPGAPWGARAGGAYSLGFLTDLRSVGSRSHGAGSRRVARGIVPWTRSLRPCSGCRGGGSRGRAGRLSRPPGSCRGRLSRRRSETRLCQRGPWVGFSPSLREAGAPLGRPLRLSPGLPAPLPVVPSPDFSFHADEHLEVYVSAAENPNHFWIQIIGHRSLQLDKLTTEMRQYYQSSGHAAELSTVQAGDIVAAPYMDGSDWYRARVLGTLENGNFDLYYVDFGDNGEAPREALRALRSDFLSLPFQAIECSLAGIVPAGAEWPEAALDAFDRLTHCAMWKPLVAKISSYVQSGLCPRPNVRLYGVHHGEVSPAVLRTRPRPPPRCSPEPPSLRPRLVSAQSLDVGAELVRLGYAVPCPQEEEAAAGDSPPPPAQEATVETPVSGRGSGEGGFPSPGRGPRALALPSGMAEPALPGTGERRLRLPPEPLLAAPAKARREPPAPLLRQPLG